MDIRDKQNTETISVILTALGAHFRALPDDCGVILNPLGQIIRQTAWHRTGGRKYLVETTITVATRWIQVEGMQDAEVSRETE